MQLADKRVLVTGGAHGCGEGAVLGMVAAGARVVATDADDEAGQKVVASIGAPDRCSFLHLDVSDRAEVFRIVAEAAGLLGGLDALVNSAGNTLQSRPEDTAEEQWDSIFFVHVKGTLFTNQAVFPYLRERGGTIINFGSSAGIRHARGFAVYGAAKGAIAAWGSNAAAEWGRYGIRVNTIAPVMESAMRNDSAMEMDPQEQYEFEHRIGRQKVKVGNGALGDPLADLAPILALLAGDGGSYITGQVIAVDAGLVMLGS